MIKIKLLIIISLVFQVVISNSQNLVPNSSFEEYYSLPSISNDINKCKYWYTPRGLSPDYFHKDATTPKYNYSSPIVSIPKNIFGYQKARTGNAYAGIISIDIEKHTYREMVAVKLTKLLKKDSMYNVSFYASLAEISKYYHNFFGITLSHDSLAKVKTKSGYGKVIAKNSITVKVDSIGNDTANWHLVQTTYKAKGDEQYLYIGITKKNMSKIRYWITKYFRITGYGDNPYSYYYIDDVSVVKIK
ncbi:MAG: hypothetical protein KAG64_07800, partial [Bacteroidales bacterium]|nr:hypothetical protein [Bacteroidales bacterium]